MVNPAIIQRNLSKELPFMAIDNIISALADKGISKQDASYSFRSIEYSLIIVRLMKRSEYFRIKQKLSSNREARKTT